MSHGDRADRATRRPCIRRLRKDQHDRLKSVRDLRLIHFDNHSFTEVWVGTGGNEPSLSGASGRFFILDLSTGGFASLSTPRPPTSVSGCEAVWIMERPTVGGARNKQDTMVNGTDTLSIVTAVDSNSIRFDWKAFN